MVWGEGPAGGRSSSSGSSVSACCSIWRAGGGGWPAGLGGCWRRERRGRGGAAGETRGRGGGAGSLSGRGLFPPPSVAPARGALVRGGEGGAGPPPPPPALLHPRRSLSP